MSFGPGFSSDEDGFSDDNEYYEFKEKMKQIRNPPTNAVQTAAEQEKNRLKEIFNSICSSNENFLFEELKKGLSVDVALESGWTPLLLASTMAKLNIIKHLVEKGANVNQIRENTTPLMYLCNINLDDEPSRNNILDCVKFLIENGANINTQDNKRRTAIMFAAYNGHLELIKYLLPLVDIAVEDNQKWDVLFWAVDGNQPKIVELLLNKGIAIDKKDLRGDTIEDIAQYNNFQEILKLFPKDPLDDFFDKFDRTKINFVQTFNGLGKNEKPQFFSDVCQLLVATRSEHVISTLYDKNMNLFEFLSLNDSELKQSEVNFPYQRNRILGGLYKFHKHPFQLKSLPFVGRNQLYSNIDVASTILTCIKQMMAMQASLKFILKNSPLNLTPAEGKNMRMFLYKNRQQLKRLKTVVDSLEIKTEMWDRVIASSDKITKKRRNIPWGYWGLGVTTIIVIYAFSNVSLSRIVWK